MESGDKLVNDWFLVPIHHHGNCCIPIPTASTISVPLSSSTNTTLGRLELVRAIVQSCSKSHDTKHDCEECSFLLENAKYLKRQILNFIPLKHCEKNATSMRMSVFGDNVDVFDRSFSNDKQKNSHQTMVWINDRSVASSNDGITLNDDDVITILIPVVCTASKSLIDPIEQTLEHGLNDYPYIRFRVQMKNISTLHLCEARRHEKRRSEDDLKDSRCTQQQSFDQDDEESPLLSMHHFSQMPSASQKFRANDYNYMESFGDNITVTTNSSLHDSVPDSLYSSKPYSKSKVERSESTITYNKKAANATILDLEVNQLIHLRDVGCQRQSEKEKVLKRTILDLAILRWKERQKDGKTQTSENNCGNIFEKIEI